jgi:hypothetical protein
MPTHELTDQERAWVLHAEALKREAREIVARHPECDEGDVYHALRNLELSPAERLRQGLTRVRRRSQPHSR